MTTVPNDFLSYILNMTLSHPNGSHYAPSVTPDLEGDYDLTSGDLDTLLMMGSIGWKLLFVGALLTGFCGNLFIVVNVFGDSQMRNTNYFFVLNLVLVDLFVILGVLVVKEVALAVQSESHFLICFPTVWNFAVNYTASNYFLLFLCYEKFVLILLPFRKDKLLRWVF